MDSTPPFPWDNLPPAVAAAIAADLGTANPIEGGEITNGELLAELRGLSKKSPDTLRDYCRDLVELVQWLRGQGLPDGLLDLQTRQLVRYFAYLETDERRRVYPYVDERGRSRELVLRTGALAPSSLKGQKAAIVALCGHATRMDYRDYSRGNPTFGLELPTVTVRPGLTLTVEERQAILATDGSERDRAQAFGQTYLPVRVRVWQILQWADVDFETDTVTLTMEKHGVAAQLPLHPKLKPALLRWRRAQREEALERAAAGNPGMVEALSDPRRERVFLSRNGRQLAKSTFGKQIKWRARRAGVLPHPEGVRVSRENTSRVHNHAYRRSFGRDLRRAGVPLERIADGLLHRDESTTRRHYAFGDAAELRATFDAFDV